MIVGDSIGPIIRSRHLELRWATARSRAPIRAPFLRGNGQSAGVAARDLVFCLQIAENARSLTPVCALMKARAR